MVQALVGGRVKKWHLSNQERALHSGVRCGDWMTVMGRQRNRERSRDRLVTGGDGSLDYPNAVATFKSPRADALTIPYTNICEAFIS